MLPTVQRQLDCGIKNVATWTINPLNGNLVGGTRDGKVFVWDYKNNNSIINIIRANTTSVKSIHITPNGIMYIIYSSSIYAINTLKNYEIVKRMIIPNKNPFFSIGCFFSDDKVIASSNEGLCFWDLKKQKNIISYHKQVKEYSLNTFFINILSNNIVYSYDKQIYILEELENKKNRLLYSHANPILSLVAFEDNVFSISIEGDLIVWDFLKETNETFHFNLEEVEYVFLTKERELFLFKKYFKKIEKYSFANGVSNPTMFVETIPYQISSISCSAYSSNHRKAAIGMVREYIENEHSENISGTEDYYSFMVIELDLETCIINEIIEMYDSQVQSLAFSPDGNSLAVGLMDGSLKVLNLVNRKKSVYLETFDSQVQSLAFSPDGNSLAVGLMDGSLHVIKIGSVIINVGIRKLHESIQSLAYSPDGKTLAVGIKSGALLVFSAESHNVLIEMKPGTIELNGIEIYNVHRISNDKLLIVALLSSLIIDEPFINLVDSNIHRNDLDNYICFIIHLCEAYNDSNNLPDYNILKSLIMRKYSDIFSNSDNDLLENLHKNINRSIQSLKDSNRIIELINYILTKSKEIDYKEKDEMLKEHYLPIVEKVLIGSLPFDEANKEIDSIFENKFYFAQFGACFDRILKDWGIIGE